MITNLFSIFEPSSSTPLINNWLISIFFVILIYSHFWLIKNNIYRIYINFFNLIFKEFKIILFNIKGSHIIFITLIIFILINNFIGLFPYIFTSSAHITLNLTLSLPLWVSFILFGWFKFTNKIFTHLTPQNTPSLLIPFIVLIETISNIIRPITLSIRLTANIIAGHLLLTLLGNTLSVNINIILIY